MPGVRDDRHRPIEHSSYNPELNCFWPLDNEFVYTFLEVLESLKVDNILPQKIAVVFPFGHGSQNDVYLLPKELD